MYKKILGGLVGAAAGDAMGAATEARSEEQILEYFGGRVEDLEVPPMDTFGAGNKAGGYTDDFSSAYFVANEVVKNNGIFDDECIKRALVEWSEHKVFFDRFAGPTTRRAIKSFKGEKIKETKGSFNLSRQATNGSAMRISPIGLIDAGNLDQAIEDAVKVAAITHNNNLAISGACAVSAAVAQAVTNKANLFEVIKAGLYGAEKGEKIGSEMGIRVAGPSVYERIILAVKLGMGSEKQHRKVQAISDIIGTGLHISEAVPTAFGIISACDGDAMETVIEAVNIGYDTDTIATIAGGIVGALNGADVFPEHFISVMTRVNGLDLEKLAKEIVDLNMKGC